MIPVESVHFQFSRISIQLGAGHFVSSYLPPLRTQVCQSQSHSGFSPQQNRLPASPSEAERLVSSIAPSVQPPLAAPSGIHSLTALASHFVCLSFIGFRFLFTYFYLFILFLSGTCCPWSHNLLFNLPANPGVPAAETGVATVFCGGAAGPAGA